MFQCIFNPAYIQNNNCCFKFLWEEFVIEVQLQISNDAIYNEALTWQHKTYISIFAAVSESNHRAQHSSLSNDGFYLDF